MTRSAWVILEDGVYPGVLQAVVERHTAARCWEWEFAIESEGRVARRYLRTRLSRPDYWRIAQAFRALRASVYCHTDYLIGQPVLVRIVGGNVWALYPEPSAALPRIEPLQLTLSF